MITQTGQLNLQNPAAMSRLDYSKQAFAAKSFRQLPFTNANSTYAWGRINVVIDAADNAFTSVLAQYGTLFEQYRIRRITAYAQVGKGMNNDDRIKTLIGSRVDNDNFIPTAPVSQNVSSILQSQNVTIRTFTEKGNVQIATWRPSNRPTVANYSQPVFPSNLQWHPTNDYRLHSWKGLELVSIIPDITVTPNAKSITVWCNIEVEFRGRIMTPDAFTVSQLPPSQNDGQFVEHACPMAPEDTHSPEPRASVA
jgi:hypothetical protein